MRLLPLILLAVPVLAQAPPPTTEAPEAMRRLSSWAGTWSGEGWMRVGPGEPERFKGVETIESKLGGHLILIEGKHHRAGSDVLVHHAFATVSFDATTGGYKFRSHLANGRGGDYTAEWNDGAFIWFLQSPGRGKIKFTIRIEGQDWHEIGEMERNGKWVPYFEMRLKRM